MLLVPFPVAVSDVEYRLPKRLDISPSFALSAPELLFIVWAAPVRRRRPVVVQGNDLVRIVRDPYAPSPTPRAYPEEHANTQGNQKQNERRGPSIIVR